MAKRKYFNSAVRNATDLLNELIVTESERNRRIVKSKEILVTDIEKDADTEYAELLYEQYLRENKNRE